MTGLSWGNRTDAESVTEAGTHMSTNTPNDAQAALHTPADRVLS